MTWMANKISVLETKPVSRLKRRTKADEGYAICPVCGGTKCVVLYEGKRWEEKRGCVACEETGQIPHSEFSSNHEEVNE